MFISKEFKLRPMKVNDKFDEEDWIMRGLWLCGLQFRGILSRLVRLDFRQRTVPKRVGKLEKYF